jgi:hypothetical protein
VCCNQIHAAREAGLKTIPSILVQGNFDEIALVENLLCHGMITIEVVEARSKTTSVRLNISLKYF